MFHHFYIKATFKILFIAIDYCAFKWAVGVANKCVCLDKIIWDNHMEQTMLCYAYAVLGSVRWAVEYNMEL